MSGSETMDSLNWVPQVKTNHDSVDNKNRYKPRLTTNLTLKYLSSKEDNFKRLILYFKVLDPQSLNIVNHDMNENKLYQRIYHFGIILMIMNMC